MRRFLGGFFGALLGALVVALLLAPVTAPVPAIAPVHAQQALSPPGAATALKSPNFLSFTPSNPSGTTSTTAVMMGLGSTVTVTPTYTGRIFILATMQLANNTASDGAGVQIATGTGGAPANGAAATGTVAGNLPTIVNSTATATFTASCCTTVTGLTVGTAVWIDLQCKAITGGTATPSNISFVVIEL